MKLGEPFYWSVSVSVNGENVVTIEPSMVAGKPDLSELDKSAIRTSAEHLLAFVGPPKCPVLEPDTGYDCELATGHDGPHRAFINAWDEEGQIRERQWSLRAEEAEAETTRLKQERDAARRLVDDILEERSDELTKEACDRCEQCGKMVMCAFHSVLSALAKLTWTTPACEREAWKQRASAAEARVLALEQQIREVCICAAIKLSNGEIWRGHRHDDCLSTAGRIHPRTMLVSAEQGFITSRNRFVGREEGAELQRAAGIRSAATGREVRDMLFSEDLYMRDSPVGAEDGR